MPSALLVGDADYPPVVEANRLAAAVIAACEFTVPPRNGHLPPPLREPDLVLAATTKTLARAGW